MDRQAGQPDEATRNFFTATYAQPGGMRAGFAQFTAFSQDAKDNQVFEQVKLTTSVLAVGREILRSDAGSDYASCGEIPFRRRSLPAQGTGEWKSARLKPWH